MPKPPRPPRRTNQKFRDFAHFRTLTDPLADKVVSEIISSEATYSINELFSQLRTNDSLSAVNFPPNVAAYFKETAILPSWTDPKKIAIGQQVYAKYGPQIALCLLCKSLPEAYACAKGAKVLYATGRLTEQNGSLEVFTRRLMETSQFVVNVCVPGGLAPSGKGIETAQKVRLIHAAIRYYILKHPWPEENGAPINQQDMAGTLQSFSALTLQGLEILKIDLTDEEKEGYFHCWRVVGHVIGLQDALNPPTYKEGLALGQAILNDQMEASKEGQILTQAVCEFMASVLPGNAFEHTPDALIRYLVGDKIADQLGLEETSSLLNKIVPRLLQESFRLESEIEESNKVFSLLIERVNVHLMQGLLHYFNKDKNIRFYIPPNLRSDWNINE